MSVNINECKVAGRLARDPEVKQVGDKSLTQFTVVVNREWKAATGEWKESPADIDCKAWGGLHADLTAAKKGDCVFLSGHLQSESWEAKDGTKRSKVVINVQQSMLLLPRGDDAPAPEPEPRPSVLTAKRPPRPSADSQAGDDDVPF